MAVDEHCLAQAEERARAAYREPGRHYHDERHLADCLDQLDEVAGLQARDRRLLRWAILWHDCVYDAMRNDNEERSARFAYRELVGCGVPGREADEVERLILLTKGHRAAEDDRLGAILVSIDLSILGSEPERYRRYADAVRREYAQVTDDAWRAGRIAVLEKLLAADPLFPAPQFAQALDVRARRNMSGEISRLRGD